MAKKFYANIWPENVCFAVLIYFGLCIVATVHTVETGLKDFYRPAHLAFGIAMLIAVCNPAFWTRIRGGFRRDWGAMLLGAFCLYFFFRAATYPSPEISSSYLKWGLNRILVGLALGFFIFYGRNWNSPAQPSLRQKRADLIALAFGFGVLIWASARMLMMIRKDVFLIAIPEGTPEFYQTFADYLIPLYLCMVLLMRKYLPNLQEETIYAGLLRSAAPLILAIWCALFAQLIGSNNGSLSITLIGIGLAVADVVLHLKRRRGRIRWFGASALAVQSAVLMAIGVALVVNLPPLRMFGFQPISILPAAPPQVAAKPPEVQGKPVLGPEVPPTTEAAKIEQEIKDAAKPIENSSVNSRWKILVMQGLLQLKVNMLFGDLGAEIITGKPGEYIHSLLSIQSHTGILGTLLLLGFLISRLPLLFGGEQDIAIVVFVVAATLVALMATFFIWLPIWFVGGILLAMPYWSTERPAKQAKGQPA